MNTLAPSMGPVPHLTLEHVDLWADLFMLECNAYQTYCTTEYYGIFLSPLRIPISYSKWRVDTHTMTIYTEAKINHKLPPTEHRIGLSGSLALRCAAFSKCCAAQCQTLRETDLLLSRLPFVRFILAPVYMVLVSVCTLFNACCSLSLCACGL